ncbi:MAG: molybdate ABC transporter substrate-binding protein [Desulfuromonadaceae bacterium]|nr:molybdate ABC transporter substrate-binding protein [Desulfuromonadaceae bacterium]
MSGWLAASGVNPRRRSKGLLIALLVSVLFAGPAVSFAAPLHVYAGVGMREMVQQISHAFEQQNPGVQIVMNFAPSGVLARQIEAGAPASVFFAAHPKWMDWLTQKNAIAEQTVQPFVLNTLVFVSASPLAVPSLDAVAALARIGLGHPDTVPAGTYAKEALTASGAYGSLEKQGRLLFARDVRQALLYADQGEVDGAFVYATDAPLARSATVRFEVPQALYTPIVFPVCLTRRALSEAGERTAVEAYLSFLTRPEVRTIVTALGYRCP